MASKTNGAGGKHGIVDNPMLLSNRDETVPKTHIGLYSILRNPKNKNVYLDEKSCQKIRLRTFQGVLDLINQYGGGSFEDFWNVNREELNYLGYNHFSEVEKLAPIIGLIECFSDIYNAGELRNRRRLISFGINRELLAQYFANVELAKTNKTEVIIPELKRASQKDKNIVIFGEETVSLDGATVKIEKNALYRQFKHWCQLKKITPKEGIMYALDNIINQEPIDGLHPVGEYQPATIFDKYFYVKPTVLQPEIINVKINPTLLAEARKIIERYNYAPENNGKPKLDLNLYINNAIFYLNQKMPLQYSNPELYKEKLEVEKMEETNG